MKRQIHTERLVRVNRSAIAMVKAANSARMSKRARIGFVEGGLPYMPPEDWHAPPESRTGTYRIVRQPAGDGYQHVVTPAQIRDRLSQLPAWMIEPLDLIQLSCMTKKKQTFPCYGMQWGSCLYLYPIEEGLVEYFYGPPKPAVYNESRMYGGKWKKASDSEWHLVWTERTIRDFYLNNILLHELGHLLDERNSSYVDRERYAEWFALEYGYKASRHTVAKSTKPRKVRRRHHGK